MSDGLKVSVLVPVYNELHTVERVIERVCPQLEAGTGAQRRVEADDRSRLLEHLHMRGRAQGGGELVERDLVDDHIARRLQQARALRAQQRAPGELRLRAHLLRRL